MCCGCVGEVLDKSEPAATPLEDAAMAQTPTPILASPVSVEGADDDTDPDGPAPMVAQDTQPAAPAGMAADSGGGGEAAPEAAAAAAAVAAEPHAEDGVTPASSAGLGGIRGTSADVQRDYSDPSVNIQGELRELSDIAGLRSPMGGLLADPERLLQSQSWWSIASAGGAGDPGGSKPGSAHSGGASAGGASAQDADGGHDAARLSRRRKVCVRGRLPPVRMFPSHAVLLLAGVMAWIVVAVMYVRSHPPSVGVGPVEAYPFPAGRPIFCGSGACMPALRQCVFLSHVCSDKVPIMTTSPCVPGDRGGVTDCCTSSVAGTAAPATRHRIRPRQHACMQAVTAVSEWMHALAHTRRSEHGPREHGIANMSACCLCCPYDAVLVCGHKSGMHEVHAWCVTVMHVRAGADLCAVHGQ